MGIWTRREAQVATVQHGLKLVQMTTLPDGTERFSNGQPLYEGLEAQGYWDDDDDAQVLRDAGSKVGFDRPKRRKRYQGLANTYKGRRTEINLGGQANFGVLESIEAESGVTFDSTWVGDFDDLAAFTGLDPERLLAIYNGHGKAKNQRSLDDLRREGTFTITA
jgi:hypothetical protein